MARAAVKTKEKKIKPSVLLLRNLFLSAFFVFIGFVVYQKALSILKQSDYFIVQDIIYQPSLEFIAASGLLDLKGKSLFEIDLKTIQKKLQWRYPQFSQLRVLRKFPNQIEVVAYQRIPFAQLRAGEHSMTLDPSGVVFAVHSDPDNRLPLIIGVNPPRGRLMAGSRLEGRDVQVALAILKSFRSYKGLGAYHVLKIDVDNLSQINLYLSSNLKVIIDEENFHHKLKMLELVLSQPKLDLAQCKYIDVRFKEPVLGNK